MLSSHQCLCFSNDLFLSDFLSTILHICFHFMRATCPTYLLFLVLTILVGSRWRVQIEKLLKEQFSGAACQLGLPEQSVNKPRVQSVLHILRVESCLVCLRKLIPHSRVIMAVSVIDPDVSILLIAKFFYQRHMFLGPDCIPISESRKEWRCFTPRAELLPRR
jgi:hypothetical protein